MASAPPDPPGVRVTVIICGLVAFLAVLAAIIYVGTQGRDATALYAIATALGAGLVPGALAAVRVEQLRRRMDRREHPPDDDPRPPPGESG